MSVKYNFYSMIHYVIIEKNLYGGRIMYSYDEIKAFDPELSEAISKEIGRQNDHIELDKTQIVEMTQIQSQQISMIIESTQIQNDNFKNRYKYY